MGIKTAFDKDISNKFDIMSSGSSLTVDDVIHGASMSVTEKGTEAGAVTVVTMFGSAMHEKPPLDMNFNRPFITAIVHIPTGEYLFIGRVENPDFAMEDPDVHND
jgi:serpin B